VVSDPGETGSLADEQPEKLRELMAAWDSYVRDFGGILTE